MIDFPTRIIDYNSHSSACLDLFIFSNPSICSTLAFFILINYDRVVASVCIYYPPNTKWDALFYRTVDDYFRFDWDSLRYYLRDVLWSDIFKLGASVAGAEYCECIQVGIDL